MNISDEAVEAAAKGLWAKQCGTVLDESHYQDARAALEAVAPHMLAEAWDDGAKESANHWAVTAHDPNPIGPTDPPANPYRIQS